MSCEKAKDPNSADAIYAYQWNLHPHLCSLYMLQRIPYYVDNLSQILGSRNTLRPDYIQT